MTFSGLHPHPNQVAHCDIAANHSATLQQE